MQQFVICKLLEKENSTLLFWNENWANTMILDAKNNSLEIKEEKQFDAINSFKEKQNKTEKENDVQKLWQTNFVWRPRSEN